MDKILHDLKDPKLWELWYIPYYGSCRILSINRSAEGLGLESRGSQKGSIREFPKIRGTLFWGPYDKDPII